MNRIRLSGTAAALLTALLPLPPAAADIPPPPPVKDKKPAATAPPALAAEAPAAAVPDSEALPGKWEIVGFASEGNTFSQQEVAAMAKQMSVEITKDRFMVIEDGEPDEIMEWKIDPAKSPKWIDFRVIRGEERDEHAAPGIYELKGDELKLVFTDNPDADTQRPTVFESRKRSASKIMLTLKRQAAAPKAESPAAAMTPAATVQAMLKLAEAGKWEELIRTYTSPEDLENVGGDAEEIKEAASDFAKENGETFIRVFKKIKDTAPEMSGNDTIAKWQLPEPVGGEESLTLFLKDGRWFIQDP